MLSVGAVKQAGTSVVGWSRDDLASKVIRDLGHVEQKQKQKRANFLKQEIRNEEADQAKTGYNLHGNAGGRGLLDTHTGGAGGNSFLCVLVHSIHLSLAKAALLGLLPKACDGGLSFDKLLFEGVVRG